MIATRIEADANNNAWLIADGEKEIGRFIFPSSVTTIAEALAAYDSIKAELEPGFVSPEAKRAAVNAERQRRVIAGKVIDGIAVTGRDEDARNLTNLALAAQLRIAQGDTTTPTTFRDGDNTDHDLTPPQMLSLWQQSAEYVSALYAASWQIKAMDPLPEDVTADELWPADEGEEE